MVFDCQNVLLLKYNYLNLFKVQIRFLEIFEKLIFFYDKMTIL